MRAARTGLMGTLDIDGQKQTSGQSEGAYTQLTLTEGLYLGGHPNFDHTSRHANVTQSFTGCLQKVGKTIVFTNDTYTIDTLIDKMRHLSLFRKNVALDSEPCLQLEKSVSV